ncbi:MAG TPA: S8 family serine peptidase [Chiayiivirga sp.]|nr:S8 family serine peptidase [Chiayiivirga sp.]
MGTCIRSLALSSAIGVALAGASLFTIQAAQAVVPNLERDHVMASKAAVESYIISFAEEGLINYTGGIPGLARTAPEEGQHRKLDRTTTAAQGYEAFLSAQREAYISGINATLGRNVVVTHSYGISFNGIAVNVSAAEAAEIAKLAGVTSVKAAGTYYLDTYRGPAFIGADQVWSGVAVPGGVGNRGAGVKVGIIDSGANSSHPSFANDASCGFSVANPKLIAVDCSSSSGGICNGANPEAASGNGHGVHTASTVAGNTIDNTVTPAPNLPDGATMSGVAPCAQVYSYLVCATNSCSGAWIAAAIQNAIADGVDVINFSISGGTSPWTDNDRAFLDAVGNGTFVAASAGNNSQSDPTVIGKVNHRGPWVTTVAASTHDQLVGGGFSLTGPGTPPAATQGAPLMPGSTTSSTPAWTGKPVKTYPTNPLGCTAGGGITAGSFTGSIAVLRRGTCNFSEKITNAYNAGAEMVVIANNAPGVINMNTDGAPAVPAFSTTQVAGDAVISFVDANPSNSTADVTALMVTSRLGDVLADFSFRGPTPSPLADLTKPDITAPGVDIYAATDPGSGQYQFMSGTSMSGPHVAGAGALMVAVHPSWTPMEIRSALMTTAKRDGYREDETSPWNIDDVGSGRVDVAKAAMAGLTMDETKANFLAANPSGGSINIKQLNIPSLRNLNCVGSCSWTRTFKNQLPTAGSWTIAPVSHAQFELVASPSSFNLAAGQSQTVTFTATPNQFISAIAFDYVVLSENASLAPAQHLTVALKGNSTTLYTVGGSVSGLTGVGLALALNGGSPYAISADGPFTLPGGVLSGNNYTVTVATQPSGQFCTVANGSGTIGSTNVTNVNVTCVAAVYYEVGGSVTGLTTNGLSLKLNGGNDLAVPSGATSFNFSPGVLDGSTYSVTIGTQPAGQTCLVSNGGGTATGGNITSVSITCADAFYTVGGAVQGLAGPGLKLQINGAQQLNINGNGNFTFAQTLLTQGQAYDVQVTAQPITTPQQTCSVSAGNGTINGANVTDVLVDCAVLLPEIFKDGFEP